MGSGLLVGTGGLGRVMKGVKEGGLMGEGGEGCGCIELDGGMGWGWIGCIELGKVDGMQGRG